MKLNYKRTIFVGFAFFLICAFWQAYDNAIPLILTNKFGMSQTWSGLIMALDNILALFLLPLFGAISDRHNGKRGKRTPFITIGTIIAVVTFVALSFVDAAQLKEIDKVSAIDDVKTLEYIYDEQADETLMTPDGEKFVLKEQFTREEFSSIKCQTVNEAGKTVTTPEYTDYVTPARQACIHEISTGEPGMLILFIAVLLMVLLSMSVFRSPAVALMPDVTIKPLRSKANAVINLMGSAGGIVILGAGMLLKTSDVHNSMMSYVAYFGITAGVMLIALFIFRAKVNEPKLVEIMHEDSRKYGIEENDIDEETGEKRKLSRAERRSLIFILASIVFWFMGYNAVTSKYSVYAGNILNKDYNTTMMIAQVAAIAAYLPVGMVASKFGRKRTILAGVVMLCAAFGAAAFVNENSSIIVMYLLFALAGIGWATINVNSFPMVVEMCSGGNVGKYTGYYYTASMAAQVVTPMVSGYIMDSFGMKTLFPYAAIFVALAFVTMLFVMHGDSKPIAKKGLDALDVDD